MKAQTVDVKSSTGRVLCCTVFRPGGKKLLAKGHVISEEDIRVLESEGMDTTEMERLPAKGVRFIGSDTTNIYCYPSCRNARRITARHRVTLRSADDARRAGFRACKVCRPVDAPFRAAVA